MRKLFKSALSVTLVLIMMVTMIPVDVFAATPSSMIISASTKTALVGSDVDVDITLKNNPGVSSIGLNIAYDKDILSLKEVKFNSEMEGSTQSSKITSNPVTLLWVRAADNFNQQNVLFATLTFTVNENAQNNAVSKITMTYDPDDVYNIIEENIDCTLENGSVTAVQCVPGDINGDTKVNNKDVSRLMQYLAHWDVTVNEPVLDVNGDTKINNKDISRLMQYLAHWDVEIFPKQGSQPPVSGDCNHQLIKHDAIAPECEKDGNITYWHCSVCNKSFKDVNGLIEVSDSDIKVDATGHNVVLDPAVPATYENTGLTEGSHCSVCGKIIQKQEVIPKLENNENHIIYHVCADDAYLQSVGVTNPNPNTYTSQDGLKLKNLRVEGYIFEGWYDGEGANGELVKTIPAGTTGEVELYAKWTEREYTINFDSPDVPVSSIKYTVSKGATLTNAKCYGYTFVGWSDDNGFLRSKIKPGTTGNITLHANWTSNRNRATAFSSYAEPSIIEDNEKGQFIFLYDIGRIDNVPLSQIEYLGNSDGINIDNEYQVVNKIEKTNAEKIADIVSNTTTRSSSWTLSEEWEKIYEAGNEIDETKGKSEIRTDTEGNTIGGNYFVSNSKGGASHLSTDSGSSYSNSARVTTEKSAGINGSYDKSSEKYCDVKLGAKNETELSAGASFPVKIVDVSVGVKNTTTLSADVANGRRDNEAVHFDASKSSYIGTDNQSNESGYYNVSASNSSNWNSTESYQKSYQQSRSTSVSNAINEQITKKTTYNVTDSISGANSQREEVGGTEGRENEYSTTVQYSEGDSTTKTQKISFKSNEPGYYRLVNAGTLHVFAVVGYDVATSSYYTYSYTVLDDERHTYLDFSLNNALFDDCQNALVPFEVPFEVTEYVTALTTKSDDLEFGLDGKVNGYEGTDDNATVILPQYYSAKNGADGSNTAVKITSFNANTFKNNKQIKRVVLPVYISEIPDGAFEGCTNLEEIVAMGVTKIGDNAFKGCTSLKIFTIDNMVTSLGNNAFEGVDEIKVMASKVSVFNAALTSGAKKITVNVSKMAGSIDNRTLTINAGKDYFALLSNGTTYSNLRIKSAADETYISNMTLTDNTDTPLDITSNKLTLNRVSVDGAPGFAMLLRKENTEISLYDVINLVSSSGNAVLSKNIALKKENNEVSGTLNTTGDVLVCGTVQNENLLKVKDNNNNRYEPITEEDFNRYISSSILKFDPNGGNNLENNTKTVYYGQAYGKLPTPKKDYHDFLGWFTESDKGEQVNENTIVSTLGEKTIYAHWTPHIPSGWVKASDVPNGAKIENRKWSYTQTYYTTSSSPNMDGWVKYNETSEWGSYGAWSGWSTNPVYGSDSREVDVRDETNAVHTGYHLECYNTRTSGGSRQFRNYSVGGNYSGYGVSSTYGEYHYERDASIWEVNNAPKVYAGEYTSVCSYPGTNKGNDTGYILSDGSYTYVYFITSNIYENQTTRYYRYRDRSRVYTYYFKQSKNLESTSYPSGNDISNIQEWVQYIEK